MRPPIHQKKYASHEFGSSMISREPDRQGRLRANLPWPLDAIRMDRGFDTTTSGAKHEIHHKLRFLGLVVDIAD
jgi:hypothetical protein